jgi:glucosamine--fructose-6-phosphate aminotransferase (isomerizing)
MTSRGGTAMAAEMADQPRAIEALLEYRRRIPAPPLSELPAPRAVLLIARGSSDHAATYGRYLLEATLGIPVTLCAPSLWTRYRSHPRLDGCLAIAISQSGRTPEIARVLELATWAGATTLAITNDVGSPLAEAADFTLALGVGSELAVPATKSFMAELLAFVLLAETLGDPSWTRGDPERIPAAVQAVLDDQCAAEIVGEELSDARAIVHVAAGYLYAIAHEGALKMIETASFPVMAYSATELLHGPIAVAGPTVPVICYATPGPVHDDMAAVAEAVAARHSPVVWVGDAPPSGVEHRLGVETLLPEPLMPLLHVVRGQQLALGLSRAVGLDADLPQGLSKVTATS